MKKRKAVIDRISQIIEKEGITKSIFAKRLGISWTSANNIITGRNVPSYENLVKIIETFEWVDANWLVMGEESSQKDTDKEKLYALIGAQQKTIEKQQGTIDRLTRRLIEDLPEDNKKVSIAR